MRLGIALTMLALILCGALTFALTGSGTRDDARLRTEHMGFGFPEAFVPDRGEDFDLAKEVRDELTRQ